MIPGLGRSSWRRKWQTTPVFLPGKSHGRASLAGNNPWDCKRSGHNLMTKQQQQSQTCLLIGVPTSAISPLDPKAELGTSFFNCHSTYKHFLTVWMHDDINPMSGAGSQMLCPERLWNRAQRTQSALSNTSVKLGLGLTFVQFPPPLIIPLSSVLGWWEFTHIHLRSSTSHILVWACSGCDPPNQ